MQYVLPMLFGETLGSESLPQGIEDNPFISYWNKWGRVGGATMEIEQNTGQLPPSVTLEQLKNLTYKILTEKDLTRRYGMPELALAYAPASRGLIRSVLYQRGSVSMPSTFTGIEWPMGAPKNRDKGSTIDFVNKYLPSPKPYDRWLTETVSRTLYLFYPAAVNYVNTYTYLRTLDRISEPIEYLRFLRLYKSAGLSNIPQHYINVFEEILSSKYLEKTFSILDVASIEDLPYAKKYYSTLINSVLPEVKRILRETEIVSITHKAVGNHYFRAVEPFNLPTKFSETVRFSPREIELLEAKAQRAAQIILMNIEKLEGRIAQLETPGINLQVTERQSDPFKNPFLVYDRDTNTFQNVAQQDATSQVQQAKSDFIDEGSMRRAPEIRARTRRTFLTSEGARSAEDVTPPQETGQNWGALVAAGVIAAVAISELV